MISFLFFCFFFRQGEPLFVILGASVGVVFELTLRRPQELGDQAFPKAGRLTPLLKKPLDGFPRLNNCISKGNIALAIYRKPPCFAYAQLS